MSMVQAHAASLISIVNGEGKLDDDLNLIKKTLAGHLNLKAALTGDEITVEQKLNVIEEVFRGRVSAAAIVFLQLLAVLERVALLPQIADEFARRFEAVEKKVIAQVTTAIPLDAESLERIRVRLTEIVGKDVAVRAKVDPGIVGGIVVKLGGKRLDGSVRNQLERLKDQMLVNMKGR